MEQLLTVEDLTPEELEILRVLREERRQDALLVVVNELRGPER